MGSRSRKLRRQGRERQEQQRQIEALVADARRAAVGTAECAVLPAPEVTYRVLDGWGLGLSLIQHETTDCWHLSAMLHPAGRSSTTEDWTTLGALVAAVAWEGGWRGEAPPQPLTPLESTHPALALHWQWHADQTPVDPKVLEATAAYFRRREALQPRDGTWKPRG